VKTHVEVDKKQKDLYITGSGNAYDTAWGGSENKVYTLNTYEDHVFKVHLTEKTGNTTWYRGVLNGKTVWIEAKYLSSAKESNTSLLGHIRSGNVELNPELGDYS